MLQYSDKAARVLSAGDPPPVEVVTPRGASAFVLSCEHAGRAIPKSLGDLGVPAADMERHIAYDVGAEGLSRQLSDLLDAPLVLQRYSRLVIDCNRPLEAPDCMPVVSDGTAVPANAALSPEARHRRFVEIHQPFHDALAELLDVRAAAGRPSILISVHSFTPRLRGGPARPWEIGALSNRDASFATAFLAAFRAARPDVPSAHNEPYVVDDASDYTIPVHGERRGLPHLLLEIRNDLIGDDGGQARWARLIADALVAASTKGRPDGR
ncbi:MAG: N-formylglutamate amidohydrolase [Rhizobiaceae bacterium]|nr:N-formylglutamate amidohydrolase [Rhizobiaceae bacterium]